MADYCSRCGSLRRKLKPLTNAERSFVQRYSGVLDGEEVCVDCWHDFEKYQSFTADIDTFIQSSSMVDS